MYESNKKNTYADLWSYLHGDIITLADPVGGGAPGDNHFKTNSL